MFAIPGKKSAQNLAAFISNVGSCVEWLGETSVSQNFLILASCYFMLKVEAAEVLFLFLASTVSSERFLQENAAVVCDN